MVSHRDIMGLMLFFHACNRGNSFSWMVKVKWFVTGSLGEMVCHAWNGRWFAIDGLAKMFCDGGMTAMISH